MSKKVFVNRKEELKKLESYLDRAEKGEPAILFISGETGVGKDCLVERFLDNNRSIGSASYVAALEHMNIPFHPFRTCLETLSKRKGLFDKDVSEIYSHLKDMTFSRTSKPLDLVKQREGMFSDFTGLFECLAGKKTLVLVIDNLQWCDEGSILLLQHLAVELKKCRLLVMASYKPEELEKAEGVHPVTAMMAALMMQDRLSAFVVEGFDKASTGEMLAALLNSKEVPEQFVEAVQKETEGNPMFISELVEAMLKEKIIDLSNPYWADELDMGKVHITGGMKEVITRRLELLSKDKLEVLKAASVIGLKFSLVDLSVLIRKKKDELSDLMSDFVEARLVFEALDAPVETYCFDHSNIRDILYESLSKKKREELHRRLGEVLEMLGSDTDNTFVLAYHFCEARDVEKGYRYAKLAGDTALGMNAPNEAFKQFHSALSLIDNSKEYKKKMEKERVELSIEVGKLGYIIGDWEKAIKYLESAIATASKLKNWRLLVNSLIGLGDILRFKAHDNPKIIRLFALALSISERKKFHDGIAASHRGLGFVRWREGKFEKAEIHYRKCIASAKKSGDVYLFGEAYTEMGNVTSGKGDLAGAVAYYQEAIKILTRVEHLSQLARAYNNLGDAYLQMQKWDLAIENFEKAVEVSEKIGYKDMKGWALFNTGEALAKKGELKPALEKCIKAQAILKKLGDRVGVAGVEKNLGIIYSRMRKWTASEKHFRESARLNKEINYPHALAETYIEWGQMCIDKGDAAQAKAVLKKAIDQSVEIEAKEYEKRARKVLAKVG